VRNAPVAFDVLPCQPRPDLIRDAALCPPPALGVVDTPARTVRLHRDAKMPDGSGPWLSDAWKVIAPDAAPVSSLPLGAIEGQHFMSLFWQVVPPTLHDPKRVELAERWLGCSLQAYIERDRNGRITSYKPALKRLGDCSFVRKKARQRWGQDRSLRELRVAPLKAEYATTVDIEMRQAAAARWEDYRKTMMIRTADGTVIDMPDAEQCDRRNYAKLIAQGRGWASMAHESGKEARLVTITLPPAYHPTTTAGSNKRRPNTNYSGISPRATHDELHRQFRLFSRDLGGGRGHLDVDFDFLRTVQPHKDCCPHWHLVIFARPDDWPTIIERLRARFVDGIPDVTGAPTKHRIKIDKIKGGVGGALAYVSRALAYITRCVDGQKDADEADRTAAWASTWGIRRYEFSGKSFSTLWRMLGRREFADNDVPELVDAVRARRLPKGDFLAFCQAVIQHELSPWYVDFENKYAEQTRRLAGVRSQDGQEIQTWEMQHWEIIPRPVAAARCEDSGAASASPLVLCNNCAQRHFDSDAKRQAKPGSGSIYVDFMPNGPPS
jgi:hypothetical protein